MKKLYTFKAITDFLSSGKVANYKVTKVEKVGFNEREGSIYHVNVKLETPEGYRDKLVTFEINSTYIDEIDDDETFKINSTYIDDLKEYETLADRIESLLFSYYVLN